MCANWTYTVYTYGTLPSYSSKNYFWTENALYIIILNKDNIYKQQLSASLTRAGETRDQEKIAILDSIFLNFE